MHACRPYKARARAPITTLTPGPRHCGAPVGASPQALYAARRCPALCAGAWDGGRLSAISVPALRASRLGLPAMRPGSGVLPARLQGLEPGDPATTPGGGPLPEEPPRGAQSCGDNAETANISVVNGKAAIKIVTHLIFRPAVPAAAQ